MYSKKQVLGACLCTLMGLTIWTYRTIQHPRRINRTVLLDAGGKRISSIFEGSRKDKRFDWQKLPKVEAPMTECGSSSKSGLFSRMLGLIETGVLAQGGACTATACQNTDYVPNSYQCGGGAPCNQMTYRFAYYSPGSNSGNGGQYTGTSGCTSCTTAECEVVTCTGTPPPPLMLEYLRPGRHLRARLSMQQL